MRGYGRGNWSHWRQENITVEAGASMNCTATSSLTRSEALARLAAYKATKRGERLETYSTGHQDTIWTPGRYGLWQYKFDTCKPTWMCEDGGIPMPGAVDIWAAPLR